MAHKKSKINKLIHNFSIFRWEGNFEMAWTGKAYTLILNKQQKRNSVDRKRLKIYKCSIW